MSGLPDYYKLLGVKPNAKLSEIKKAYRDKAKKYHPDIDGSKEARDKFDQIQKAYEILEDDKTRRKYDTDISLEKKRAKAKNTSQRPTGKDKPKSDYDPTAGYKSYEKPEPPKKPKKEHIDDLFEGHYAAFLSEIKAMDYREKGNVDKKRKEALENDKFSDHRFRAQRIQRGRSSIKEEMELMDIQLAYLKVLYEYSKITGSDDRFNPYREMHEEPSNLGYYAKKITEYKRKILAERGSLATITPEPKKSFWQRFF